MALPTDTRGGLGGGDFFKPESGNTKILILADAIEGYEYWTNDDKVVRSREKFDELENPKIRKVKRTDKKTGIEQEVEEADRQKYFWGVPVYNFSTESVQIFQIGQKGIRDELVAIQQNDDWGDPVKKYTLTINKTGEGLGTKYKVTPNPDKAETKKEIEKIVASYEADPLDLENIFFKA